MKKILRGFIVLNVIFFMASLFSVSVFAKGHEIKTVSIHHADSKKDYVEGEVIVKFKDTVLNLRNGKNGFKSLQFAESKNLDKKQDFVKNNLTLLKVRKEKKSQSTSVEQTIVELKKDSRVEYAEPNYKRYSDAIETNDVSRALLWGLDNTGQTINGSYGNIAGTIDKDIDAPEAWMINEGTNASVVVAIIDTGVAYNHPDLAPNMWDGTNCKDENGNALGGCNHGYDFASNDKTPLPFGPESSHGTHVAGTIAAVKNNSKGMIGVAPNATIMAIRFGFDTASEIRAIDFAIQNGTKVINASYGGAFFSQAEYDAINRFRSAGGIFVAAAGNDATSNELSHHYPSDYNLDNIISVAATDQNDALAPFSDYGVSSVDVGAPGTNIYSAVIDETGVNDSIETFEESSPPGVPDGWVKEGINNKWATHNTGSTNVLYGQFPNFPYDDNTNSLMVSPTYHLSDSSGVTFNFTAQCDTEYTNIDWRDYMQLEYSSDGINFLPANDPYFSGDFKWDEAYLDLLNGDENPDGGAVYSFQDVQIPTQYLTSQFKFRFRWVTNSSVNNFDGCSVDDVFLKRYTDKDGSDESYGFKNGTSMATPHVVGLAALIGGFNPSLTAVQIKNAILSTGDSLVSLNGKTTTGKRINAQKALQSVNPAKAITSFNFASPSVTGIVNEGLHTIALTVPFGTTVTTLVPTIVVTGSSVSPLSGVAQDFTSPVTYTVTAADASTQIYVVTVAVDADSNIALVAADKSALVDSLIQGTNADLSHVTGALTNPLPSSGTVNSSTIVWDSSNTSVVSSNGQTITRPTFASDDATVSLTATITKGLVSDTKIFTLTVLKLPNPTKAISSFNFASLSGTGVVDEGLHTITLTVPFGTNVTVLVPTIVATGSSVSPLSGVAQDFTSPVMYTVTAADASTEIYVVTVAVDADSNIALVAADKAALVDSLIQGANADLSHIIGVLTNPLPALGANGSTITWISSTPSVVSHNGQTMNRPIFANGNASVSLTATITKGLVSDTKVFSLTVLKLPASTNALVTSGTYTVSAGGTANETIVAIPFGTAKATFLAALIKGETNQTWNSTSITDPVVTNNTLIVTAEDGVIQVTYTVTVTAAVQSSGGGGGGGGGSSGGAVSTPAASVVTLVPTAITSPTSANTSAISISPPTKDSDVSVGIISDPNGHRLAPVTTDSGSSPFNHVVEPISKVQAGWLIRSKGSNSVYYVGADGKRHVFWNALSYFSWSDSWNDVVWATDATLPTLAIGSPILPRPGVVLVKIVSDPNVYKVDLDEKTETFVLRRITSEAVASAMYGLHWADYVVDLEPTLFGNYAHGKDVTSVESVDLAMMKTRTKIAALSH